MRTLSETDILQFPSPAPHPKKKKKKKGKQDKHSFQTGRHKYFPDMLMMKYYQNSKIEAPKSIFDIT